MKNKDVRTNVLNHHALTPMNHASVQSGTEIISATLARLESKLLRAPSKPNPTCCWSRSRQWECQLYRKQDSLLMYYQRLGRRKQYLTKIGQTPKQKVYRIYDLLWANKAKFRYLQWEVGTGAGVCGCICFALREGLDYTQNTVLNGVTSSICAVICSRFWPLKCLLKSLWLRARFRDTSEAL